MLSRVSLRLLRISGPRSGCLSGTSTAHAQPVGTVYHNEMKQMLRRYGTSENTRWMPDSTPDSEATLVLDENPISSEEYFALPNLEMKRCRKETARIWSPEALKWLIPVMRKRSSTESDSKEVDAEWEDQNPHPVKTLLEESRSHWRMTNGKPVTWERYFGASAQGQHLVLDQLPGILAKKPSPQDLISKLLQESEEYIIDRKYNQQRKAKSIRVAIRGWKILARKMSELQSRISEAEEPPLQGLVFEGHHLPWSIYMSFEKRPRTLTLNETLRYHDGRRNMSDLLVTLSRELEDYILFLRARYQDTGDAERKIWKAWRYLTTEFRMRAGKDAKFMYSSYKTKRMQMNPQVNDDNPDV
ncbi:hypothetical protein WAI453_011555 [Rhynchosporium graminicola]